jgi:hypothetical protein
MSKPTLLKTLLAALASVTLVCLSTPAIAQHGGGHAVAEEAASTAAEGDSPAAAMVAATVAEGSTAEPMVAAIAVALAEAGITPDQVPTAVAVPTEACAAARPPCAVPTTLGLQKTAELVIPHPDGIPSSSLPTTAQCRRGLVQQRLAGLARKLAQAITRQRLTRLSPTDNGTASEPRTQPQLWRQTVR